LGVEEDCVAGCEEARQFALVSGGAGYRLLVDDEVAGESQVLQPMLDQLGRDLMVHVANHAPDRVFVHAGVVGWQGRALVLPGTSFAGKTTLVAELVRAGATYCSDEYAVLDEKGEVHPYARDLRMRERGGVEQRGVGVAELNGSAGDVALAVAHVVFTEYVEGGRWRPERVSAGVAVLETMRHSIAVQRTPGRVMATLAKMMETASAVRSVRGEAVETAGALLDAMSRGGFCE
jgi:serine kinase of HPr protein (carbohydrate metabolism regulator)